jgi:branched-chain amino acid aminotransferase
MIEAPDLRGLFFARTHPMAHDYVQANTNGRLHDAREPSIAPLNRGFLYGDAVYEVWRTYCGVLFAWEEHWERLEHSAGALALALPWSRDRILEEIRRTAAEFAGRGGPSGDVCVRLQITRGGGPIGLDPALADRPDYVLLVRRNQEISPEELCRGVRLSFAQKFCRNDRRTLDPSWKTGNYLNNLLCLREARARGADEAVITNLEGEITEAAVSNICFVRDGVVLTPCLDCGLLGGITRQLLIGRIAPAAGVDVCEIRLKPGDLGGMQECFLTSTTRDLVPVAEIDGQRFDVGAGSVTRRLKAAFADHARAYAQAHPELKVL